MIVNRYYKLPSEARVRIMLPGRKLQELDRMAGEWSRVKNLSGKRIVELKLAPGDGRLFRVTP